MCTHQHGVTCYRPRRSLNGERGGGEEEEEEKGESFHIYMVQPIAGVAWSQVCSGSCDGRKKVTDNR